jgi:hypothetical protein
MTDAVNDTASNTAVAVAACVRNDAAGIYAKRFECRPAFVLDGEILPDVIDASIIRERYLEELQINIVRISDVLATPKAFIGFGLPNEFITVPAVEGGYKKADIKSVKREPTQIVDTRNLVQSGLWLVLADANEEANEALREAMQHFEGSEFWTCANGCMNILARAGFTAGDTPLTDLFWPYECFKYLTTHDLMFKGQKIQVDVVCTSPLELTQFSWGIKKATWFTLFRHANRKIDKLAKKYRPVAWMRTGVTAPLRCIGLAKKKVWDKGQTPAPALPDDVEYHSDIEVRVSKTSRFGTLLRLVWGSHGMFEAVQTRVNPADFFEEELKPFPVVKDRLTRIKKKYLFNEKMTRRIMRHLAEEFVSIGVRSEKSVYDAMRTNEKYNLVVTGHSVRIGRVRGGKGIFKWLAKAADWILSKHVLMSEYRKDTYYAAEVWKDKDGVIHINMNSGTFQPTPKHQARMMLFARALFPHWRIVADA